MTPPPATPPRPRNQKWPPERDALLRLHYPALANAEVGVLLGCSAKQVASRASALFLHKSRAYKQEVASRTTRQRSPWNPELEELMALLYPHAMPGDMEALLGMGRMTVLSKAQNMGVKKTKAVLRQIATERQAMLRARSDEAYRLARFQPGHTPWNTGTTGLMGSNGPTRYRTGNVPYTHLPVGTVRLRTVSGVPGVLLQKVANPDLWRPVYWLVWEEATGQAMPPGHVMTFQDGCRHNLNPENLLPVTRKEWALRVSPLCNPDLHPDHATVLRLRGALTRNINNAQKRINRAAKTTPPAPPSTPPPESPKP